MTNFDKYESAGAYHWRECDPKTRVFNPPLVARYALVLSRACGARALDVGAGDGYLTARLAKQCGEVIGLEYDDAGVNIAQDMLHGIANASVSKGSAYEIPFEDNSFDVVVMADVIEHLEDPEKAIAEMARVAAAESSTYITTPQWRSDRVWDIRHVKEYRPEELADLVRTAYRSVEMVYAWPRRWINIYRTRLGWRALRCAGRRGFNPFLAESATPAGYCQMMAIGREPR